MNSKPLGDLLPLERGQKSMSFLRFVVLGNYKPPDFEGTAFKKLAPRGVAKFDGKKIY